MTYDDVYPARRRVIDPLHGTLLAFPIACFSLTVVTDIAYVRSLNLLWLHFSEWLLLFGLVVGVVAIIVRFVDFLARGVRHPWPAVIGGVVVLLLATLNNFIHTEDGWNAVMPWGLTVSILTVVAMLVTGWLGRKGAFDV